jgi:hypothetical protein
VDSGDVRAARLSHVIDAVDHGESPPAERAGGMRHVNKRSLS